jgi:hypothetical protein
MFVSNSHQKLVFISMDLVGVTAGFKADLLRRLRTRGYTSDQVFISATHTHSGPGALSKNFFWEAVALDFYQKAVYESVMNAAYDSVLIAERASVPAVLSHSVVDVDGLQHNRRGHPERVERKAHLIWAKNEEGAVIGSVVNYAIHGIAYDDDNLYFSADVPGGIEHAMKSEMHRYNGRQTTRSCPEPIAVFINSAEGDTSPNFFGKDGIERIGRTFAEKVMGSIEGAEPLPERWRVSEKRIRLPIPGMNVRNCMKQFRPGKPNEGLKYFSKDAALHLVAAYFPAHTRISLIRWGDLDLMTWPGEPTTQLGWKLRDVALASGAKNAMILGLTNDHLAYFTSSDEFYDGGYEACFSLYGAHGGEGIVRRYQRLASEKLPAW